MKREDRRGGWEEEGRGRMRRRNRRQRGKSLKIGRAMFLLYSNYLDTEVSDEQKFRKGRGSEGRGKRRQQEEAKKRGKKRQTRGEEGTGGEVATFLIKLTS